jgi:hypothetical protein
MNYLFKETNIKSGNTLGKAKGLPLACYLGPAIRGTEWESNLYFCVICGKSRNIGVDMKELAGRLV